MAQSARYYDIGHKKPRSPQSQSRD